MLTIRLALALVLVLVLVLFLLLGLVPPQAVVAVVLHLDVQGRTGLVRGGLESRIVHLTLVLRI
jgi:hypothetical protein